MSSTKPFQPIDRPQIPTFTSGAAARNHCSRCTYQLTLSVWSVSKSRNTGVPGAILLPVTGAVPPFSAILATFVITACEGSYVPELLVKSAAPVHHTALKPAAVGWFPKVESYSG